MEAYYNVVPRQYPSTTYFVHQHEDPWSHEQALYGMPIDRCDRPTAHHYARELQYPSLNSRWIDEYRTLNYPSFEAGSSGCFVPETISYPHQHPQRCSSPSLTGTSPSQFSSSYSDRQSTPLSSPTPSLPHRSPHMDQDEIFPVGYGGQAVICDEEQEVGGPCVSMHDVQPYEDTQIDRDAFEDDQSTYYPPYIQEGYHTVEMIPEASEPYVPEQPATTYVETRHASTPNIRRRRQATHDVTSHRASSKVSRRSKGSKRSSSHRPMPANEQCNGHALTNPNRAFPCPFTIYGCTSTFGSKNEWKRHINTQHMRLGYWRCDLCDQSERKPNDFNRKDLFIQHVRRMHPLETTKTKSSKPKSSKASKNDPEEQALAAAALRCWKYIRSPPEESGCLFCGEKFKGANTWDERLEHIGRHMESAKKDPNEIVHPEDWQNDEAMEDWLLREEIIVDDRQEGYTLAEGKAA